MRKLLSCSGIFLCFSGSALAQQASGGAPGEWSLHAAFGAVVVGLILANAYVVGLFHAKPPGESSGVLARLAEKWEFSPQGLGGFSWRQLALWSLLALFFELLMIRWISSEIRVFAYFKNFVLIACFLGFGLGCYMSRRRVNLLTMVVPLLTLALVVKLPWQSLRVLISSIPTFVGASSEVHVWGVPAEFSFPLLAAAIAIIVPTFSLICFSFIPLGQVVGWYLENASNGILAYSVNVLASLAGILLYTLLCFLYQPPLTWFVVAGLLLVCVLWNWPWLRWAAGGAFVICLGLLTLGTGKQGKVYWSPYQKLTLAPRAAEGKIFEYELTTNDIFYQQILDLSPEFVAAHPSLFAAVPAQWNAYNLPYHFYSRPPSVLVLGSGMGNDVAAALRNGAGQVTAVEIDPLILKLGEKYHFEKPYSSPRVRQVQDDARSYVQNSRDRFDLIVFSLLDSHTTSSHYTNIRIDNYVYTLEALQASKRLLNADGVFVVKFQVDTPWIAGRLYGLLQTVFGHAPLQIESENSMVSYTTGGRFFITGSERRIAQAIQDPQLAAYLGAHGGMKMTPATLTTDNWPYFYQHEPGLPASVIVISVALVLLCWVLLRDTGTTLRSLQWHFFFLGAGFMLLEAQIVSKMALLFGTTWLVNSVVIAGLLLLIVGANLLVQFFPRVPVSIGYAGIFLTLLASYLIPLEKFFYTSLWAKALSSTLVLCMPVLFAGIVFIRSFAEQGFRADSLGSNLMGAMIGGMLESMSLWTGIRSLLGIAALLYVASWIALSLERSFGRGRTKGESDFIGETLVGASQGT
jgi:spermidine synthase